MEPEISSRLRFFSLMFQYFPFHKSLITGLEIRLVLEKDEEVREKASNRCTDCKFDSIFLFDFMASKSGSKGSSFSTLNTVCRISIGISRIILDQLNFPTPILFFHDCEPIQGTEIIVPRPPPNLYSRYDQWMKLQRSLHGHEIGPH